MNDGLGHSYVFNAPYGYPATHPRARSGAYLPPPHEYLDSYYGRWSSVELPTQRMLSVALMQGMLGPNERESGFVYFERVSPDEETVTLNLDVVDPKSGKRTRLDFPFVSVD